MVTPGLCQQIQNKGGQRGNTCLVSKLYPYSGEQQQMDKVLSNEAINLDS